MSQPVFAFYTAGSAGDWIAEIAELTELSQAVVRRRLERAHGNTQLRNVFKEDWPGLDNEKSQGGGPRNVRQ